MTASAIYVGSVTHHRLRPRTHRLRYRAFWMLLDLDEVAALGNRLRLFSCHRFNLFGLRHADHGAGTDEPLRDQVVRHLAAAGIDIEGGAIRLFCMPRILGYAFNPLSVYFCHRRNGELAALLYEVHNTFGERHTYLAPVTDPDAAAISQRCDKAFHVSPFIPMAMRYEFRVVPPRDRIAVTIGVSDGDGLLLTATLAGRRTDLTDAALLRVFVTHPLMTLTVIGAIHWEALRLWWKGVPVLSHPAPPPRPVTVVRPKG
jgi:DUF1365 family protein